MPFFNKDEYIAECTNLDVGTLQQREIHYHRTLTAQGFAFGFGAATAAATSGAAWPLPVIASAFIYVVAQKLRIIENELTSRGVELHDTTLRDAGYGIGSGMLGALVGTLFEDDIPPTENPGGEEVKEELAKWVPGEIVGAAFLAATMAPPPKRCARSKKNRSKYERLNCDKCSVYFDASFSEWFHCCDCDDNYDICTKCAPSTNHDPKHHLYKIKGEFPTVHSSVRSNLDISTKCKGCRTKLLGVDVYSCEDCFLPFDVCLDCYSKGLGCTKHPKQQLYRQHVKA